MQREISYCSSINNVALIRFRVYIIYSFYSVFLTFVYLISYLNTTVKYTYSEKKNKALFISFVMHIVLYNKDKIIQ